MNNGSDMPMDMGMSDPSMMGGDPNAMGGDPSMMSGDPNAMMGGDMGAMGMEQNPYAADFDAGVAADEEEDPKTFIQQLVGKLSQSLRKYNENQPQPDEDLNKYVAGMVVSQAVKAMTPEDATEVMNKIKDGTAENGMGMDMNGMDMDMNGGGMGMDMSGEQGMPPMQDMGQQQGQAPMMEMDGRDRSLNTVPSRARKSSPYAPLKF